MACEKCKEPALNVVIHGKELWCWPCHNAARGVTIGSHGIVTDSIPGGIEIKHGVCWPDGTPRKFYDKSAIKQAAYENGWFQGDNTPKESSRFNEARHEADEKRSSKRGR